MLFNTGHVLDLIAIELKKYDKGRQSYPEAMRVKEEQSKLKSMKSKAVETLFVNINNLYRRLFT